MNRIGDKKYMALLNLFKPVGVQGMKHVGETPWSLPETRTFTCACGHKRVLNEAALTVNETKDEKGDVVDRFVNVNLGGVKCEKCGSEVYELLTFANRYGLIKPVRTPRKKKAKDAMLPLEGAIDCRGGH